MPDENYPNEGMIAEAKRGLEWRREYGRGGTGIGVARARDISRRANLSDDTIRRMHSYFSRHEVDKKGQGFSPVRMATHPLGASRGRCGVVIQDKHGQLLGCAETNLKTQQMQRL
jgi:hypothetical protein